MAKLVVTTNTPKKFEKPLSNVGIVERTTNGKITTLEVKGSEDDVNKIARNIGRRATKTKSSVGRSS